MTFLKTTALRTAAALGFAVSFSSAALAEAETYTLDPSHSQVMFSYTHLGLSTTFGMFSGFEGEIEFDPAAPETSSVSVSIPTLAMFTGWEARDSHFQSEDFLGSVEGDLVTFTSTGIEVTRRRHSDHYRRSDDQRRDGRGRAGYENELFRPPPFPASERCAHGWVHSHDPNPAFQLWRGAFAPFVSDELDLVISIEAMADAES